jgi:monoamine oxidase
VARVPTVLIVGAGLTGCTVAHRLGREGVRAVLLERAPVPGGLMRSAHLHGVLDEPHGSHIFHTEDDEVWALANAMPPFNGYRHRVEILADGRVLNWRSCCPTSTASRTPRRSTASWASAGASTSRAVPRQRTSRGVASS